MLLSSEKCKEAIFCKKQNHPFQKRRQLTFLPRSSSAVAQAAPGTPGGWWRAPAAPSLLPQPQLPRQRL